MKARAYERQSAVIILGQKKSAAGRSQSTTQDLGRVGNEIRCCLLRRQATDSRNSFDHRLIRSSLTQQLIIITDRRLRAGRTQARLLR